MICYWTCTRYLDFWLCSDVSLLCLLQIRLSQIHLHMICVNQQKTALSWSVISSRSWTVFFNIPRNVMWSLSSRIAYDVISPLESHLTCSHRFEKEARIRHEIAHLRVCQLISELSHRLPPIALLTTISLSDPIDDHDMKRTYFCNEMIHDPRDWDEKKDALNVRWDE